MSEQPRAAVQNPLGKARLRLLAAGVYAWGVTVALQAIAMPSVLSVAFSAASLLFLLAATALITRRPVLARWLGIPLFCATSFATWVVTSDALSPARIDPTQGFSGSLGWTLYVLGWGGVRHAPGERADQPAIPLAGNHRMASATLLWGACTLAALGILAMGWRSSQPDRAPLVQAAAVASALAIVVAVTDVASSRARGDRPARLRITPAVATLAVLGAVGLWWFLRR